MTPTIVTTTADTPAEAAAETMLEEEIGSLLLTDDTGEPTGVVTATDFLTTVAAGEIDPDATVAEFATDDVVTVAADATVTTAAARMSTADVQHLPVTDETGLVGMVSATDLTGYLSHGAANATE